MRGRTARRAATGDEGQGEVWRSVRGSLAARHRLRVLQGSGGLERGVGEGRELDADGVVGVDGAGAEDDGHDAGAGAAGAGEEAGAHEVGAEVVHEAARGAEAGEFDDGGGAEVEAGGEGEVAEIEVHGG